MMADTSDWTWWVMVDRQSVRSYTLAPDERAARRAFGCMQGAIVLPVADERELEALRRTALPWHDDGTE